MLFGEGVPIAGCLILHMLGQRHRFELFDFCSHVFSVHISGAHRLPCSHEPCPFVCVPGSRLF